MLLTILSFSFFLSAVYSYNYIYLGVSQACLEDLGLNEVSPLHSQSNETLPQRPKLQSNTSDTIRYNKIYRDNPELDNQPSIYIPGWNLTRADMELNNIKAVNYTKNIETETNEYIESVGINPTYIYQKISIKIDQYINNVSLFIQDDIKATIYDESNSWEVAVLNCSNDKWGTPNGSIKSLLQPHPINDAAHWELFDFLNSDVDPVFLNTSQTNWTLDEVGNRKYWFALRVKIPPNDPGLKLLYLNPDGGVLSNIGEGDTFKKYLTNERIGKIIHTNAVDFFADPPINGTRLEGTLNSFKDIDSDRFIAEPEINNLTIVLNFTISNLTSYTIDDLKNGLIYNFFSQMSVLTHMILRITTKVSAPIDMYHVYVRNYSHANAWVDFTDKMYLYQEEETSLNWIIGDWNDKIELISLINTTNDVNKLSLALQYNSSSYFNVSINKCTFDFFEPVMQQNAILPHDPMIRELLYPNSDNILNGTHYWGPQDLEKLKLNDDKYYFAQSETNNLSMEFKFNLDPDIDSSYWQTDVYDFMYYYPNPVVPVMEIRIVQNVSIESPNNLSLAILEAYKGDRRVDLLSEAQNQLDWVALSEDPNLFANITEKAQYWILPWSLSWLALQFVDPSDNSIRLRLRYVSVAPLERFNVTIDEFTVKMHLQNLISSDITCKIGFGLDNNDILPSHIELKVSGIDVVDSGIGEGTWDNDIFGVPTQGYYEFNVTSIWNSITFDVVGTFYLEQYDKYTTELEILEIDTYQNNTIYGTKILIKGKLLYNGTTIPIDKETISIQIISENGVLETLNDVTNSEGIFQIEYTLPEGYSWVNIKLVYSPTDSIYASTESRQDLRIYLISQAQYAVNVIINILPLILIISVVLAATLAIRHQKLNKLRAYWAEDATTLNDLLNITSIIIILKDSGVSVYNKMLGAGEFESNLISGFLHAIAQFKKEIKRDLDEKDASKGFIMDYGDFKIVIYDGQYARVALILDRDPSDQLRDNQRMFTGEFEDRFKKSLENFTGAVTQFQATDIIVEKYFNISLMSPLRLGDYTEKDFDNLNILEKALIEVAEEMQKEKKFFFVSSLLSFGLAGRKESREKIISNILSLKNKRILIPVQNLP